MTVRERRFSGDRMREARVALKNATKGRKGSQRWLADQIGAHVTSVSDWERGANTPSARYIAGIAEELGVSIEELYGGSDDEEESSAMTLDDFLRLRVREIIRDERGTLVVA